MSDATDYDSEAQILSGGYGYKDNDNLMTEMELAEKKRFQRLKWTKLNTEARQARSRGLITDDEYNDWISGNAANGLQRLLGMNKGRTGGVLETIGDIFSMGTYASVALASGMTEYAKGGEGYGFRLGPFAPGIAPEWLQFNMGFSPEAAKASWQAGRTYQEYFNKYGYDTGFWGGLAADILLDPTTYMTFGVGAGAKVFAKGGMKAVGKVAIKEGAELTMTKFGRSIYRLAAQDLSAEFAKEMAQEGAERFYLGGERLHMLDASIARKWQERIAEHMTKNFDILKLQYLSRKLGQAEGKSIPGKVWAAFTNTIEKASPYIPGTDEFLSHSKQLASDSAANIGFALKTVEEATGWKLGAGTLATIENLLTHNAEDMFFETTSKLKMDRGLMNLYGAVETASNSKIIAKLAGASPMLGKAADIFDRGWDADPRYLEARRLHQNAVAMAQKEYANKYMRQFADFSEEERDAITRYVESGHMAEMTGQGPLEAFVPLDDKIKSAISFFKAEMDDILNTERQAGMNIGRIENYVTHIYRDPAARSMVLDMMKKNQFELISTGNRFTQQRLIASIVDVENRIGKGALITDAMEVLARRRYASIEALEKQKFYGWVRQEFGVGKELVEGLRDSSQAAGILWPFLRRTRETGQEFTMVGVDQMWTTSKGNLTVLGFKRGDNAHNAELLDYLQTKTSDRVLHPFHAKANEAAKLHYNLVNDTQITHLQKEISVRVKKDIGRWEGKKTLGSTPDGGTTDMHDISIPVTDLIKASSDTSDPLWRTIGTDKSSLESVVKRLDKYFRTNLDCSLEAFAPDIRNAIEFQMKKGFQDKLDIVDKELIAKLGRTTNESATKISAMNKKTAIMAEQDNAIKEMHKLLDGMSTVEVRRLEGALPQEFIDAAVALRYRSGDITDFERPSDFQIEHITQQAARLRMTPSQLKELYRHALGSEKIQTAREADRILSLLDGSSFNLGQIEDDMVEVSLSFPTREGDKYLKDVETEAIPVGDGDAVGNTVEVNFPNRTISSYKAGKVGMEDPLGQAFANSQPALDISSGWHAGATQDLKHNVSHITDNRRIDTVFDGKSPEDVASISSNMEEGLLRDIQGAKQEAESLAGQARSTAETSQYNMAARKLMEGGAIGKESYDQYIVYDLVRDIQGRMIRLREDFNKTSMSFLSEEERAAREAMKATSAADKSVSLSISRQTARVAEQEAKLKKLVVERDAIAKQLDRHKNLAKPNPDRVTVLSSKLASAEKTVLEQEENLRKSRSHLENLQAKVGPIDQAKRTKAAPKYEMPGVKKMQEADPDFKKKRKLYKDLAKQKDSLLKGHSVGDLEKNRSAVDRIVKRYMSGKDIGIGDGRYIPGVKTMSVSRTEQLAGMRAAKSVDASGIAESSQAPVIGGGRDVVARNPEPVMGGWTGVHNTELVTDLSQVPKDYTHKIFLPRSIAKDLQELEKPMFDPNMNEALRRFLVGFDAVQQYFKTNLMAPMAGFYMRNLQSNIAMNVLRSGFEIFRGDWLPAMHYIMAKDGGVRLTEATNVAELGEHVIESAVGRSIKVSELYHEMSRRGILSGQMQDILMDKTGIIGEKVGRLRRAANAATGAAFGAMAGGTAEAVVGDDNDIGSLVGAVIGGMMGFKKIKGTLHSAPHGANVAEKTMNEGAKLIQSGFAPFWRAGEMTTEIPTRVALFVSEFRKTGSLAEATNTVHKHMNDWGNISVFERRVIRRAMPFYAWTKLAIKQTLDTAINDPQKLRHVFKAVDNWNKEQHAADPEDVPDFLWNKLYIVAGKHVITSPGLPVEDVAELISAALPSHFRDVGSLIPFVETSRLDYNGDNDMDQLYKNIVGRSAFGVQSIVELLVNKDSLSGDPIYTTGEVMETQYQNGKSWREAPDWMKMVVGYRKTDDGAERVNPVLSWLLGSKVPQSRMMGAMRQVYDAKNPGDVNIPGLARSVLGTSVYVRDRESQKIYINNNRIKAMERLLNNVGQIKHYQQWTDYEKENKSKVRMP